ncbi:acyl carrier protein [Odoribacter lunatus]|uniref:acyl carrier protein n=1 Tax=Odoribacter lunatus TaxID=2941335 RepID=UPI002041A851|nr:acyl carrier protein [Odoribacter lunatus]
MDKRIIEIMQRVFDTQDITIATNQNNCEKWDSLHHLNLIVELETEFDVEFEPEEIAEMKSFETVRSIVKSKID